MNGPFLRHFFAEFAANSNTALGENWPVCDHFH